MKVELTCIITLNNRIYGPMTEEHTKLDMLQNLSRMIREGKGIEEVFIKDFHLIEKEVPQKP